MTSPKGIEDRWISLGNGLFKLPERLLLAHARGETLFITGAGSSMPAGLPDFRDLVLRVYERLDSAAYDVLHRIPPKACNLWSATMKGLTNGQSAEINRFIQGDYDVVLGMLERRIDGRAVSTAKVRQTVAEVLRKNDVKPAAIHKALIRLADRGPVITIVTTNFDLLLEAAAAHQRRSVYSYSLGAIPRSSVNRDFSGVLHIHGALAKDPRRTNDLIITDQDFGEFYLRRRVVPDFIYDAARLFHLVLVGYSANDAPMRYLLNAVAADGSRFSDLKERFAFVGMQWPPDPISIEDWKGRGITPIPYDSTGNHTALTESLQRWSELSAISGKRDKVDAELRRIVRKARELAPEADRDLFDHIVRRSGSSERLRISEAISKAGADIDWLDAILSVQAQSRRERE